MVGEVSHLDAVDEVERVVAELGGVAHRGVTADMRGDTTDEQLSDPAAAKEEVEVGRVEGALKRRLTT